MQHCGYGRESTSEAQAGCGSGNAGERLGGFGEGDTAVEEERNHEEINIRIWIWYNVELVTLII